MQVEKRSTGITFISENEFEREVLKELRNKVISKMYFEDNWDAKGRFFVDYDTEWGR